MEIPVSIGFVDLKEPKLQALKDSKASGVIKNQDPETLHLHVPERARVELMLP